MPSLAIKMKYTGMNRNVDDMRIACDSNNDHKGKNGNMGKLVRTL